MQAEVCGVGNNTPASHAEGPRLHSVGKTVIHKTSNRFSQKLVANFEVPSYKTAPLIDLSFLKLFKNIVSSK
jgi:hypothetical protein